MQELAKRVFYVGCILTVTVLVLFNIKNGGSYMHAIFLGLIILYGLHFVGAFLFSTTMYTSGCIASPGSSPWLRIVLLILAIIMIIFTLRFLI